MDLNDQIYKLITTGYKRAITSDVFVAPDIPERKLNGAVEGICKNQVKPKDILLVNDHTIFGSCSDGIALTMSKIYVFDEYSNRNFEANFEDINSIETVVSEKDKLRIVITSKDGRSVSLDNDMWGVQARPFLDWLVEIVKLANERTRTLPSSTQEQEQKIESRSLDKMPIDVRMAYLKVVLNFMLEDKQSITAKQLSCYYNLISRINLNVNERFELYSYQSKGDHSYGATKEIISIMCKSLDTRARQEIIISLFKDLIYIYTECNPDSPYSNSKFIVKLAHDLGIDKNKLDYLVQVIANDKLIFNDNVDDKGLNESFSNIAATAATVGVPLAALYFSGSVIGLGAAGITSGLAALGLGGLFGLSGMVTGIGALLLIGLGANKGIKMLTGQDEIENRKRKEALLLKVNQSLQRTLQVIVEDINRLSIELEKVVQRQKENESKLSVLEDEINNLTSTLMLMSSSGQITSEESDVAASKAARQRLPIYLDIDRLRNLTDEPTKKEAFEVVLEFYERTGGQYQLKNDLSLEETEALVAIFERLEYFSATSVAMSGIKSLTKGWFN